MRIEIRREVIWIGLAVALAASILGVGPTARADFIRYGVSTQAAYYPFAGSNSDFDQDGASNANGSAAFSSSSASYGGIASAQVYANGHVWHAADGRSGTITYAAAGINSIAGAGPDGYIAESAASGSPGTATIGATPGPTTLRIRYAAYATPGPAIHTLAGFGVPGHASIYFANEAGGVDYAWPGQSPADIGFDVPYMAGSISSYDSWTQVPIWSTGVAIVWGLGALPGETPDNPLMPSNVQPPGQPPSIDPGNTPPMNVIVSADSSNSFAFPVTQDYGVDSFIYLDPEAAAGYLYTVEGTRFAQFTLPGALPGGDTSFLLSFGGALYNYTAGDIFDFTQYDPFGISQFLLLGVDSVDLSAEHAPFVSGLKFTTTGLAVVNQVPLVAGAAVPEPCTVVLLGLGVIPVLASGTCRRKA